MYLLPENLYQIVTLVMKLFTCSLIAILNHGCITTRGAFTVSLSSKLTIVAHLCVTCIFVDLLIERSEFLQLDVQLIPHDFQLMELLRLMLRIRSVRFCFCGLNSASNVPGVA